MYSFSKFVNVILLFICTVNCSIDFVEMQYLCSGRVLSLVSLLPHEHRMSVVNLAVRRAQISHKLPVKSKVRDACCIILRFQIGLY